MTDRRRPATGQSGQSDQPDQSDREDNPFAPPPEGRPDQPWQPRHPGGDPSGSAGGDGPPHGTPPDGGQGPHGDGDQGDGGQGDGDRGRPWGSQWSSQQPGRQGGGFGQRPGGRGNGQSGRGSNGTRWDPTDPAQRRARFALLAGMWGFFFGLFDFPSVALLLGALALYWGITSLRTTPRTGAGRGEDSAANGVTPSGPDSSALAPGDGPGRIDGGTAPPVPAPPAAAPRGARPQTTPAVMGLVAGGLAVLMVAATYTVQLVYQDYYSCTEDALTTPARDRCEDLLPDPLRSIITSRD